MVLMVLPRAENIRRGSRLNYDFVANNNNYYYFSLDNDFSD